MLTRIITAVLGIPIVFFAVYQGGIIFNSLLFLISVLAFNEYLKIVKLSNTLYNLLSVVFAAALILFSTDFLISILLAFLVSSIYIRVYNFKNLTLKDLALLFLGLLYTHGILFLLKEIRNNDSGILLILYILIITWVTDSGAYFTGRALGKRKLAPNISPKKSIEGLIGGTALAVLVIILLNSYYPIGNMIYVALFALFGSLISVVGDLFESAIKREYEVKDSGNILPGHGGILDRIDSLLFLIPVAYLFITHIL